MKPFSRKLIFTLSLLTAVFLLVSAGSFTTTSSTSIPSLYTLSDINNFILNTTPAEEGVGHTVSTTSLPTATTFVSLEEVYANLGNLIQRERIKTGVNYLGITGNFAMPDPERAVFSTTSTSLTPSLSPDSTGYSLEDLRELLENSLTTTSGVHSFSTLASVGTSMYSLSDVYNALTSLIQPTEVATGTVYLGVLGTYFPEIPNLVAHYKMNDSAVTGGTESEAGDLGTGLVAHFPMNDNAVTSGTESETGDLGTGLIAHYLMNDNAETATVLDTTGNYNGTTTQNTSVMTATGMVNGALSFNGTTDYVDTGFKGISGSNSRTITSWFKLNSFTGPQTIWGYGTNSSRTGFQLIYDDFTNPGTVYAHLSDGVVTSASSDLGDGNWHFVAVKVSGTTVYLYVDGVLENSVDFPDINTSDVNNFQIGSSVTPGWNTKFNGLIDDVRVYDRALTQLEIDSLIISGTRVIDSSGNGNNGGASKETSDMTTIGIVNGALNFVATGENSGEGDYVEVPQSATLDFGTGDFSEFMWVKTSGRETGSPNMYLSARESDPGLFSIGAMGSWKLAFYDGGTWYQASTLPSLADGAWHYVGLTRTGGDYTFWVDGVSESFSGNGDLSYSGKVVIGAAYNYSGSYNGLIDDFRFYNRVLSSTDISNLMILGNRVADSSGNGNNGTAVQDTQDISTAGKINNALSFDGVSDYIDFTPGLNTSLYSVSFWIKRNSSESPFPGVVCLTSDQNEVVYINNADGSIVFRSNGDVSGGTLTVDEWYHIVVINGETTKSIYKNGVLVNSSESPWSAIPDILRIGDWTVDSPRFFNGAIDDFRVYGRALTEQEVKSLYFFGDGTEEEGNVI